jgi:hypothetical protein
MAPTFVEMKVIGDRDSSESSSSSNGNGNTPNGALSGALNPALKAYSPSPRCHTSPKLQKYALIVVSAVQAIIIFAMSLSSGKAPAAAMHSSPANMSVRSCHNVTDGVFDGAAIAEPRALTLAGKWRYRSYFNLGQDNVTPKQLVFARGNFDLKVDDDGAITGTLSGGDRNSKGKFWHLTVTGKERATTWLGVRSTEASRWCTCSCDFHFRSLSCCYVCGASAL